VSQLRALTGMRAIPGDEATSERLFDISAKNMGTKK
jgi:hypothetical protein